MRITTQGECALVAILNIAKNSQEGPVSVASIARDERKSQDFIEQILLRLRRARLIKSTRGVKGGYVLARVPSKISIKDVIEAAEKEVFQIICFKYKKKKIKCVHERRCGIRPVWRVLKRDIERVLDRVTLDILLKKF